MCTLETWRQKKMARQKHSRKWRCTCRYIAYIAVEAMNESNLWVYEFIVIGYRVDGDNAMIPLVRFFLVARSPGMFFRWMKPKWDSRENVSMGTHLQRSWLNMLHPVLRLSSLELCQTLKCVFIVVITTVIAWMCIPLIIVGGSQPWKTVIATNITAWPTAPRGAFGRFVGFIITNIYIYI